MNPNILEFLSKLDPDNDEHWVIDGAPRLDAIKAIAGDNSITRSQIREAIPDFNRRNATNWDFNTGQPLMLPVEGEEDVLLAKDQSTVVVDESEEPQTEMIDQEESLEEKLAAQTEIVRDLRLKMVRATRKFEEARAIEDRIKDEMDRIKPKDSNAMAIQEYLKRQKELMQARGRG